MRKIDIFTHIFPRAYADRMSEVAPAYKDAGKRVRGVPMLVDLDERFRVMDRFDEYQQVLSIATPPIEALARPADAIDLARRANDGMAELVHKYPRPVPRFCRLAPAQRSGGSRSRNASRRHRSWRSRHSAVYQCVRQAAGCPGVSAALRRNGCLRSSDLAAPVSRLGDHGLRHRGPLAVRDLVDVRMAVRNERGDGPPRFCRALRYTSESEGHHASHGRDGAVLRGTRRARDGISWGPEHPTRTTPWCSSV